MKDPRILLALSLGLLPASLHADVFNRVTISGRKVYATTPVVKQTATSTSSSSKLVSVGITNSSILDALVASGDLATKKGFTIIELLNDAGTSSSYSAYNPKTGETVAIDSDLFAGLGNAKYVTAINSSARQTSGGAVAQAYSTSNTGTGEAKVFGTPVSVFFTSSTVMKQKSVTTSGQSTVTPYIAVNYSAVLRGVSTTTQLIDAKLTSNGSTYILPAN